MVKVERSHGFTFVGFVMFSWTEQRHKKVARLLSAYQTGDAQFEFCATSETNFFMDQMYFKSSKDGKELNSVFTVDWWVRQIHHF